jgi:hypothetical protein
MYTSTVSEAIDRMFNLRKIRSGECRNNKNVAKDISVYRHLFDCLVHYKYVAN